MKAYKQLLIIALVSIFTFSCKNEAQPEIKTINTTSDTLKKEINPNAKLVKAEFKIEGMTCEMGCAKTIEKKIAKMDGVKSARVDFKQELAMVEYDANTVTTNALESTVTNISKTYKVKEIKTVDSFSSSKKKCAKKCKSDCTKKGCKGCNKKCSKKTTDKSSCAKDCKKACCEKA